MFYGKEYGADKDSETFTEEEVREAIAPSVEDVDEAIEHLTRGGWGMANVYGYVNGILYTFTFLNR